ncbi:unnamed protein product [Cercospora beticola]|nr:unnamed protein product [Cercospora beticola]
MSLSYDHTELRNERPAHRPSRASPSFQTYDLLCVGFGPTSLAVAASLADARTQAQILFVERESHFNWTPEHVLPDKSIGSSFLHDLTTLENPRSEFTFVNFLQATDQLMHFTNNSKMVPSRRLVAAYFKWAAERVNQRGWIQYSKEASNIKPVKVDALNRVTRWEAEVIDVESGAKSTVQAKRVVLATVAEPHLVSPLRSPQLQHLILHSSSCAEFLQKLPSLQKTINIAVVGADQEAAEIFSHLHTSRGKHTATLIHADSALRPKDNSPRISDITTDPSQLMQTPPEVRLRLQNAEAHSSPRVDLQTLESLYEAQYTQRLQEPDARKWRFRMQPLSEVVGAKRDEDRVRLVTRNNRTSEVTTGPAFDLVISASGYERSRDAKLLSAVSPLYDTGALTVDQEYRVNFRRDTVDRACGIWVLGTLEDPKERVDDFAFTAERGARAARSIRASLRQKSDEHFAESALL